MNHAPQLCDQPIVKLPNTPDQKLWSERSACSYCRVIVALIGVVTERWNGNVFHRCVAFGAGQLH